MNTIGMVSLLQSAFKVAPEKTNVSSTGRIVSIAAGIILAYQGIKNYKKSGYTFLLPSAYLLYRGSTGYCYLSDIVGIDGTQTSEEIKPFEFSSVLTIRDSKESIYKFWRNLENLPQVMKHLKKVERVSENKYKWDAEFTKVTYSWYAEITEDVPNERISWRSTEVADIENWGTVEFREVAQGTEVKINLNYKPAKTRIGRAIANMLDPVFRQMVDEDLRNFKRTIETQKTR